MLTRELLKHEMTIFHLRNPFGRYKGPAFDRLQTGVDQSADELDSRVYGHRLLLILEAVASADLDDVDPLLRHAVHPVSACSPQFKFTQLTLPRCSSWNLLSHSNIWRLRYTLLRDSRSSLSLSRSRSSLSDTVARVYPLIKWHGTQQATVEVTDGAEGLHLAACMIARTKGTLRQEAGNVSSVMSQGICIASASLVSASHTDGEL
ncbi:uncharacterized protein L969DRAFT_292212 [Mixia osmundae IAM 14324]|uniref:uncharacterized protein n=1 Tax=Mixia osmundae (strain CBS 9802 / IAM 14324 / JCM 22182 / KY 12970) TaxID=764103 RepID=UPI0004A55641|nr:uncharacterized protein L969DRAFT_292212 [Mixia osmundae IAM 14324]KEI41198.1 hypothetical protein L969DRAFT_292212 [Mixia osmundae IAM 14324]